MFNPLRINLAKWSNTLKQTICWQQPANWVCLTILWGWCLKKITAFSPLYATGLFPYPLERKSEFSWFSVFREYRKTPVAWNGFSTNLHVEIKLFTLNLYFSPNKDSFFRKSWSLKIQCYLKDGFFFGPLLKNLSP